MIASDGRVEEANTSVLARDLGAHRESSGCDDLIYVSDTMTIIIPPYHTKYQLLTLKYGLVVIVVLD